jgi:hypothetical protein
VAWGTPLSAPSWLSLSGEDSPGQEEALPSHSHTLSGAAPLGRLPVSPGLARSSSPQLPLHQQLLLPGHSMGARRLTRSGPSSPTRPGTLHAWGTLPKQPGGVERQSMGAALDVPAEGVERVWAAPRSSRQPRSPLPVVPALVALQHSSLPASVIAHTRNAPLRCTDAQS